MRKKVKISNYSSLALISGIILLAVISSLIFHIPMSEISNEFSYSVIIILVVMELFTNLIVETGVMQFLATKMAALSKGNKFICLWLFGILMFLVSACLNNITAVLMVLPVIFVLLKSLDADRKYICLFFSVLLALSNTGGMATPIGDAPAIIVMASGITTFSGYLTRAFPLAFLTSIAIVAIWSIKIGREETSKEKRMLAIDMLNSQYRNVRVRYDALIPIMGVLAAMFVAWCIVPQNILPTSVVALAGYCIAMVIAARKGLEVHQLMDMKSVFTIAAFLLMATVVGKTGILNLLADFLQVHISNPKILLLVIMVVTSIISGVVSAGPATAALLPIVVELSQTALSEQAGWVAIAFAASICAGSSLFMWSATAGFILSSKIEDAGFSDRKGRIRWSIKEYLPYGILNYFVQMVIALIWIMLVI